MPNMIVVLLLLLTFAGCAVDAPHGATSTGEACEIGDEPGIAIEAPEAPAADCPQMKGAKGASPKWCCPL